jgi:hypothetical protein
MATGKRVSLKTKKRAVAALRKGGDYQAIAKRLRVTPETLKKWQRQYGAGRLGTDDEPRRGVDGVAVREFVKGGPNGDGKDAFGGKLVDGVPLPQQAIVYLNQAKAAGQRGHYFRAHLLAMLALTELVPQ